MRPRSHHPTKRKLLWCFRAAAHLEATRPVSMKRADTKYAPDWVAGISIGAINAALIAGNAPADRVPRLRTFWKAITAPSAYRVAPDCWPFDIWERHASALRTLSFGQPGFFRP